MQAVFCSTYWKFYNSPQFKQVLFIAVILWTVIMMITNKISTSHVLMHFWQNNLRALLFPVIDFLLLPVSQSVKIFAFLQNFHSPLQLNKLNRVFPSVVMQSAKSYFQENSSWSLIDYLKCRENSLDFDDRSKEHRAYAKVLENMLNDESEEWSTKAELTLKQFEVCFNFYCD